MFKKFVEKGGFKKKKEYSYSSEGFDSEDEEYGDYYGDDSDGYSEESSRPSNIYHGSTTASELAIDIYHACKPYLSECRVEISGSGRWIVHVWCDIDDDDRIKRYIESDFGHEPIGEIIFYHV